ncbi:MAG: outer membrane protein transport protein [Pseudomonadota bacterium]
MMKRTLSKGVLALSISALTASAAFAGGYGRSAANIDPLFDEGRFSGQASVAVVAPRRNYESIQPVGAPAAISTATLPTNPALVAGGAPAVGAGSTTFSKAYTTFGATAAADVVGGLRCAGTYAQPYGADADYGFAQLATGIGTTTSTSLASHEFGLTCGYAFDLGKGKLHVIAGGFGQQVEYKEARGFGFGSPLGGGDIELSDMGYGYRVGLGYTIPEIALKTSLVYRSAVNHQVEGRVRNPVFPTAGNTVQAFADVTTPQSLKLSVQSGVAQNVLVFGSVEWTDWSQIQQVQVFAKPGQLAAVAAPLNGVTIDGYFSDGWTVTGGVGYRVNEKLSTSLSLTWDKGVSTGTTAAGRAGANASAFSDTWTVAAGAQYSFDETFSIRAGLAYSFLSAASYNTGPTTAFPGGATVNLGADHAIAGGLQLQAKF